MKKIAIYLTFLVGFASFNTYGWQNLDQMQNYVLNFVKHRYAASESDDINIIVHHIDPRLTLAECELPLSLSKQSNHQAQNRLTIAVACQGKQRWKIYVPVEIQKFEEIYYAAHSIQRGKYIEKYDLTLEKANVFNFPQGYYSKNNPPLNKVAKYQIAPGMPITARQLESPKVIKRGENLTIFAKLPGLNVKSIGVALEDGHEGDAIRVKNNRTKRVVQAIVKHKGLVEVLI